MGLVLYRLRDQAGKHILFGNNARSGGAPNYARSLCSLTGLLVAR